MAKKNKEAKPLPLWAVAVAAIILLSAMGVLLNYIISPPQLNNGVTATEDELSVDTSAFIEPTPDEPPAPELPPVEVVDYMSDADVGDAVIYGSYEQNGNLEDGKEPLQWIVLDENDEGLLLISRYCIDCKVYNDTRESVGWEDSSLRQWLNGEFLNNTFTDSERGYILPVSYTSSAEGSPTVTDKVTMLTASELDVYFEYNAHRACMATDYAVSQGARIQNGNTWWWVRGEVDSISDTVMYVYFNGSVRSSFSVDYNTVALRPVIWVSADAERESSITELD